MPLIPTSLSQSALLDSGQVVVDEFSEGDGEQHSRRALATRMAHIRPSELLLPLDGLHQDVSVCYICCVHMEGENTPNFFLETAPKCLCLVGGEDAD